MRETSEEIYVTLEDPHDDIEEPLEVRLLVYFEVEPDEYDGPYLFCRGGIVLNHIEIYETFEFMGRLFEVGEEFPDELEQFVATRRQSLDSYITEKLQESNDVPVHRYRDSRSY